MSRSRRHRVVSVLAAIHGTRKERRFPLPCPAPDYGSQSAALIP